MGAPAQATEPETAAIGEEPASRRSSSGSLHSAASSKERVQAGELEGE